MAVSGNCVSTWGSFLAPGAAVSHIPTYHPRCQDPCLSPTPQ